MPAVFQRLRKIELNYRHALRGILDICRLLLLADILALLAESVLQRGSLSLGDGLISVLVAYMVLFVISSAAGRGASMRKLSSESAVSLGSNANADISANERISVNAGSAANEEALGYSPAQSSLPELLPKLLLKFSDTFGLLADGFLCIAAVAALCIGMRFALSGGVGLLRQYLPIVVAAAATVLFGFGRLLRDLEAFVRKLPHDE